jgi:hypothetical protein
LLFTLQYSKLAVVAYTSRTCLVAYISRTCLNY